MLCHVVCLASGYLSVLQCMAKVLQVEQQEHVPSVYDIKRTVTLTGKE